MVPGNQDGIHGYYCMALFESALLLVDPPCSHIRPTIELLTDVHTQQSFATI